MNTPIIRVGFPVYQNVTTLDFVGPIHMLTYAENPAVTIKVYVVGATLQPVVTTENLSIRPDTTFDDCPQLDVLCVPGGGAGLIDAFATPAYIAFLQQQGQAAQWVTSVCTGALLLARAGLLDDHAAITHWAFLDCLRLFPRVRVPTNYHARYVQDGNRITCGGISSGLDFGLHLVATLCDTATAKQSQLLNQYAPAPPYAAGLPDTADPAVLQRAMVGWQHDVEATRNIILEYT